MKPQAPTCCVHLSTEVTPIQYMYDIYVWYISTISFEQSVKDVLLACASPIWLFATVAPDMIVVVA